MVTTKPRVKALLVLVTLFLLGAATGVFGTIAFVHDRETRSLREGPRGLDERRMRGIARRLDLDDEQREQVRALLEQSKEKNRLLGQKMMEECGGPVRDQRAAFQAEIKKILRPEQAARFDELEKQRRGPFGDPMMPPPPPFP